MRRALRAIAALALAACASGCTSATDGGAPPVALGGSWRYTATQTAPAGASLEGTLAVARQSGDDFDGDLEVRETDARGVQRQLAGPVSGRTLDAETVDFDAFLGTVGRRHVGTVRADTLDGVWVEGTGSATASGTFRMERVR